MTIEKTLVQKRAYEALGIKIEDLRDAQEKEVAEHNGAKKALQQISKHINGLSPMVEEELQKFLQQEQEKEDKRAAEEGVEPESVTLDLIRVVKFTRLFIDRAVNMAMNAANHEENMQLISQGSQRTFDMVVKMIKKDVDVADAQLEKLKTIESEGLVRTDEQGNEEFVSQSEVRRPAGIRPPKSIAQQRKEEEEEKEQKVEKKGVGSSEKPLPGESIPLKETSQESTVKAGKTQSAEDLSPVSTSKTKKTSSKKKRKGPLTSKFKDNGVRKKDA